MASHSVGFAVADEDKTRLERLVKKYGGGNRSAFLRVAMDHLETLDRADRLRRLQAYGAARSAEASVTLNDVDAIVKRVLVRKRKR